MQTTRKTVRYYIDRDADTPVIRSVPVSRPSVATTSVVESASVEQDPTALAAGSHRRDARRRLTGIVQASVRKYRHHAS